jgi:HSP20 family protein
MAVNQTERQSRGTQSNDQAQANQPAQMQRDTQRDTQKQEGQSQEDKRLARRDMPAVVSPFALLQRFFTDDIANLFSEIGGRRGSLRSGTQAGSADMPAFAPKIDVVQRGNELVVRADLPGVRPDDVVVEISDDAITISGERQQEHEEENGNVYRYERSYGAFFREIPLPEGAIVDQARATFNDGVLEIAVPAPSEEVSRGRRLEISRGDEAQKSQAKETKEGKEGK